MTSAGPHATVMYMFIVYHARYRVECSSWAVSANGVLSESLERWQVGSAHVVRAVRKDSNSLVEEFMLLANITAAHAISCAFPQAALRRCHPPPHPPGKLRELEGLGRRLVSHRHDSACHQSWLLSPEIRM